MPTLKVKNLYKVYKGAKFISAKNISLEVNEGEIFGFLGVNGAGKSTTIKCITGIIPFTAGKIEICGHDIVESAFEAKRSFGFVPDNHAVYDKLTGSEYVSYIASIYKVPKEEYQERFDTLVKKFNLQNSINNQIMSYSHGMKQKISIIGALIHKPKLWILDEPMVGLDPQSILDVKNYMKEYAASGCSVIFSSHNLDTVEKLCDRAVIIHGGIVIADINLKEYREKGMDLEEEFMKLTAKAREEIDKIRAELLVQERELAEKIGKRKAAQIMQKKIMDEVHASMLA
ncbi:MAG: ABC transporter ATP-binding protein [Firmicutes bacterium]|nr:ABC transporter ATP-binding protein [Bacillota bacterium]